MSPKNWESNDTKKKLDSILSSSFSPKQKELMNENNDIKVQTVIDTSNHLLETITVCSDLTDKIGNERDSFSSFDEKSSPSFNFNLQQYTNFKRDEAISEVMLIPWAKEHIEQAHPSLSDEENSALRNRLPNSSSILDLTDSNESCNFLNKNNMSAAKSTGILTSSKEMTPDIKEEESLTVYNGISDGIKKQNNKTVVAICEECETRVATIRCEGCVETLCSYCNDLVHPIRSNRDPHMHYKFNLVRPLKPDDPRGYSKFVQLEDRTDFIKTEFDVLNAEIEKKRKILMEDERNHIFRKYIPSYSEGADKINELGIRARSEYQFGAKYKQDDFVVFEYIPEKYGWVNDNYPPPKGPTNPPWRPPEVYAKIMSVYTDFTGPGAPPIKKGKEHEIYYLVDIKGYVEGEYITVGNFIQKTVEKPEFKVKVLKQWKEGRKSRKNISSSEDEINSVSSATVERQLEKEKEDKMILLHSLAKKDAMKKDIERKEYYERRQNLIATIAKIKDLPLASSFATLPECELHEPYDKQIEYLERKLAFVQKLLWSLFRRFIKFGVRSRFKKWRKWARWDKLQASMGSILMTQACARRFLWKNLKEEMRYEAHYQKWVSFRKVHDKYRVIPRSLIRKRGHRRQQIVDFSNRIIYSDEKNECADLDDARDEEKLISSESDVKTNHEDQNIECKIMEGSRSNFSAGPLQSINPSLELEFFSKSEAQKQIEDYTNERKESVKLLNKLERNFFESWKYIRYTKPEEERKASTRDTCLHKKPFEAEYFIEDLYTTNGKEFFETKWDFDVWSRDRQNACLKLSIFLEKNGKLIQKVYIHAWLEKAKRLTSRLRELEMKLMEEETEQQKQIELMKMAMDLQTEEEDMNATSSTSNEKIKSSPYAGIVPPIPLPTDPSKELIHPAQNMTSNLRFLGKIPGSHENNVRAENELPLLPPTFAKRLSQGDYNIKNSGLFNTFKGAMAGPWEGSSWVAKPMLLMGEPPINKDQISKLIFAGIDTIINLLSAEESELLFGSNNLNLRTKSNLPPELCEVNEGTFDIQVEMDEVQKKVKTKTKDHLRLAETHYNSAKKCADQFINQVTENGGKKIPEEHKSQSRSLLASARLAFNTLERARQANKRISNKCNYFHFPLPAEAEPIFYGLKTAKTAGVSKSNKQKHKGLDTRGLKETAKGEVVPSKSVTDSQSTTGKVINYLQSTNRKRYPLSTTKMDPLEKENLQKYYLQIVKYCEYRMRNLNENLYIFSKDGRGRAAVICGSLLGRMYSLSSHEAIERLQISHDSKLSFIRFCVKEEKQLVMNENRLKNNHNKEQKNIDENEINAIREAIQRQLSSLKRVQRYSCPKSHSQSELVRILIADTSSFSEPKRLQMGPPFDRTRQLEKVNRLKGFGYPHLLENQVGKSRQAEFFIKNYSQDESERADSTQSDFRSFLDGNEGQTEFGISDFETEDSQSTAAIAVKTGDDIFSIYN